MEEIQELFAFNRWANERITAACAALSPDELRRDMRSSYPTVLATLAHIAASEWIWLERWNGRSPAAPPDWADNEFPALQGRWRDVAAAQQEFLDGLTRGDLQRGVSYRTINGDPFVAPLWQLLRHVVNHSTYHRGQIVTMLRQLGAQPPSTDLVRYYREHAAPAQQSSASG